MFSLPGRAKLKVLHVGEIPFFMPWREWYKKVEQVSHHTVDYHQRSNPVALSEEEINSLSKDSTREAAPHPLFLDYDLIRFERNWGVEAFHMVQATPPLMTSLQIVDMIYKKNGTFWPHLSFKDGIHSAILSTQPYLNTKGAGLIVGSSVEAIQTAYVLVELGLKQITFVVENDNINVNFLESMRRSLFQIKFEAITKEKIILLPGAYSAMICCEDLRARPELLTAILYFNYLERGGLILNAVFPLDQVPLQEEALAIGAKYIGLSDLQRHEEIVALQKLGFASIDQLFSLVGK